jgi:hypothetical protein
VVKISFCSLTSWGHRSFVRGSKVSGQMLSTQGPARPLLRNWPYETCFYGWSYCVLRCSSGHLSSIKSLRKDATSTGYCHILHFPHLRHIARALKWSLVNGGQKSHHSTIIVLEVFFMWLENDYRRWIGLTAGQQCFSPSSNFGITNQWSFLTFFYYVCNL